jgi:hypothetical protein
VNMVIANNAIPLREIQTQIVEDQVVLTRSFRRTTKTKQLYRVPFERNSNRVKEQRFQYVQVIVILYRIFTICRVWPISPAYQYSTV